MLPPDYGDALLASWNYFVHLAVVLVPLFVGASFLVGLVQEYLPPERVERTLRGHDEGVGNVAAAGLGAVTPFCSCSTVPILAGLLRAGAPIGLAFSFLLASPLVNEVAVVLLVGLFGARVAVSYVVVTFSTAVLGGIAIGRLGLTDHVKDDYLVEAGTVATDGGTADPCGCGPVTADGGRESTMADTGSGSTAADAGRGSTTVDTHRRRVRTAAREAWSFLVDALPYLLLGMTVGALIHGVVPVEVLQAVLGPGNPLAVPLAALAGAPVYVSLSGMLPIAASLGERGIAVGTVLAFVVGGAGVSVPNLILLNELFERRLLVVYAGTVVAIAVVVGTLFNAVLA